MKQDLIFTRRLGRWLATQEVDRDFKKGAMMFLQLTGRVNMYKFLLSKRDMKSLETELYKHYNFRLADMTHAQVEEMENDVKHIADANNLPSTVTEAKTKKTRPKGKRADHDDLPLEIKAMYAENLTILRRMRELHLKLRTLTTDNTTCPDSDRYPFLKELIRLDMKYRDNWKAYDEALPVDPEDSDEDTQDDL